VVREDVVEGVRNHQQGQDKVEFVALLGPVFEGLSQYSEDVDSRLAIAVFELVLELHFADLPVECCHESGINAGDIL
jgi:hypothetical protein